MFLNDVPLNLFCRRWKGKIIWNNVIDFIVNPALVNVILKKDYSIRKTVHPAFKQNSNLHQSTWTKTKRVYIS